MTATSTSNIRSRWAALGAAVAITLGGGGLGLVHATVNSGPMAIYQPITPCRLADTRSDPAYNVGTRNTPVGTADTWVLDGWGSHGQCVLPASGPSALELNVTAVGATENTYIKVFPTGSTPATTANLNPQKNGPPAPNSVTAPLNATTGQFSVYNNAGQVNVVIDVVGYYEDHVHSSADLTNEPGIAFTNKTDAVGLTTTPAVVSSVAIRPPSDGFVTVSASGFWYTDTANRQLTCQLTDGTSVIDPTKVYLLDTDPEALNLAHSISMEQTFPVTTYTGLFFTGRPFNLVCATSAGTGTMRNIQMSAAFFPTSYAPASFPVITIPIGP